MTNMHESEVVKASSLGAKLSPGFVMDTSNSSQTKLSENDIPGASLLGRQPSVLKVDDLKFWLRCRGDPGKGLKTKAQLVKR